MSEFDSRFAALQPYPFERLRALLADVPDKPEGSVQRLSIGEPQLAAPEVIERAVCDALAGLGRYPATKGGEALRVAVAGWLERRFGLSAQAIDPDCHVLPVNGTREALFGIAQAWIEPNRGASVLLPVPGYQIYEGAAILAGAKPVYVPCSGQTEWLPDWQSVPEAQWRNCALVYVCSPGNPTGATLSLADYQALIDLADRYDFIIASDECYSEIYPSDGVPPAGVLQACAEMGRSDFSRCLAFHSLSKRSNVPGLRSGFVAGDAAILRRFLHYRTYQGGAMSPVVQAAAVAGWNDEAHVQRNREAYDRAFAAFLQALPAGRASRPPGSFYIWLGVAGDDAQFVKALYADDNVLVLPGSYLGREVDGHNPGAGYVRISLVLPPDDCAVAARKIAARLNS